MVCKVYECFLHVERACVCVCVYLCENVIISNFQRDFL